MEETWEQITWPHSPSIQSANISHQQNPPGGQRTREPAGAIHRGQPPIVQSKGGKKYGVDLEQWMEKYIKCSGKVQQHSTISPSGLIKFTSQFCKSS